MSDCPNAEIRDLLPDLLHDRLDAPTRARVVAHVDGCADCRSELEMLRSLRASMERSTPSVDVDRIVAALPKPGARPVVVPRTRRMSWRIAAAVTFLAVGGTSLVIVRNERGGAAGPDSASMRIPPVTVETTALLPPRATNPEAPKRAGESTTASPRATPPNAQRTVAPGDDQTAAGALGNRIGNLNEKQLKSLLNEIDHMDATPIIDPEPVVLRVGARATSPTGL